jgi:hypothetical protein
MKKLLIVLLLTVLAVMPGMTTAEETSETETEEITLFDARYYFEHRLLPQRFFHNPKATMESLAGTGLYELWKAYAAENGFDVTYKAAEFATRRETRDGGVTILILTMPRPEETLLCYRIYLCVQDDEEAYFTAELDEYDGYYDEGCLICGWNPEGVHQLYTQSRILPGEDDPEYEKALAEETDKVVTLLKEPEK